jgi:ketosteroid isomerase-like protein
VGEDGAVEGRALDLIRQSYEALNAGRIGEWASLLPADFELVTPAGVMGDTFVGPEGVVRFFEETAQAWESMQVDVEEVLEFGDRVVVLGRIRNRGRGSGMELDSVMAHVWTVENGIPVRAEMTGDRDEALRRGREGS